MIANFLDFYLAYFPIYTCVYQHKQKTNFIIARSELTGSDKIQILSVFNKEKSRSELNWKYWQAFIKLVLLHRNEARGKVL